MKIKTTSVSVTCPFSLKDEKVFVRYMEDNGKCLVASVLGCEKNYHNCPECSECSKKVESIFTASSKA